MAKASTRRIRGVRASTKARILEAAEDVFATKGFEGASTREIAAKAGVNISSLHYHWEAKETLYYAVFENVYNQLMEISRDSLLPTTARDESPPSLPEAPVGRVFDYFAANPNIPRLLLRRILENEELGDAFDRDALLPSWKEFGGWVKEYGGGRIRDVDAQILILTLHSTLLLFTLDSRQYTRILGGRIAEPETARRIRAHLIQLSALLLSAYPKTSA
jgi:AcrR family transcriptional regulator